MATNIVLEKVYETLLCSPGMNEAVKIDVKLSRKTVLLMNSVIAAGLDQQNQPQELIKMIPQEDTAKLKEFADECLTKAGLKELSEKMAQLTGK